MALKETIEAWNEAVILYEKEEFSQSLQKLSTIQVSSKICYNQGVVSWRLNKVNDSLQYFNKAIQLDNFLAVAYFQRAWIQFSLHRFMEADKDLESAETYLRGSHVIDYKQLGLPVKLHVAQILCNRAVVRKSMNDDVTSQNLLSQIQRYPKDDPVYSAIDLNNLEKMVLLQPKFALFRPPKSMVSNLTKKDFLGKSQLISSVHDKDYDERKSSSTPVSPTSMRRNKLTVTPDRRMALTPPPTRPPPRVKGQQDLNHTVEFSKSLGGKEIQKEKTAVCSISQSVSSTFKPLDSISSVNPGKGYSNSQTRIDSVKCVPQRPVPMPTSQSHSQKFPVPPSKSVPKPPLRNSEQTPKPSIPNRPVPRLYHSTQDTVSALATKPRESQPINQPIPLNKNKEKPSRPPPPALRTS